MAGEHLVCTGVTPSVSTFYECKGYRLPTDAEYEYATRAGTTTATYAGSVMPRPDGGASTYPDPAIDAIGWCDATNNQATRPVAQKTPNSLGLYDMIGNAYEWVDGNFQGGGYGPGPLTDPFGTLGEISSDAGKPVVAGIARGGGYNALNTLCRSAARLQITRTLTGPGGGFRLVRTRP